MIFFRSNYPFLSKIEIELSAHLFFPFFFFLPKTISWNASNIPEKALNWSSHFSDLNTDEFVSLSRSTVSMSPGTAHPAQEEQCQARGAALHVFGR